MSKIIIIPRSTIMTIGHTFEQKKPSSDLNSADIFWKKKFPTMMILMVVCRDFIAAKHIISSVQYAKHDNHDAAICKNLNTNNKKRKCKLFLVSFLAKMSPTDIFFFRFTLGVNIWDAKHSGLFAPSFCFTVKYFLIAAVWVESCGLYKISF